ncbi:histidine kinase [Thiothrix nivea]|uniref:Sensor protein n=1 Tax=Thiothrix nivea (strain ATCC 35100 / DSM 5205 / JP2) TaxID=870187 RepID=A0A656HFA1_THINJ|nr:histidine kinase [Thiothrix nivea]EIJ33869.1 integral membrane sensor signal transduction histidine kinase [Thiothrix nivea DSM 5205]
MKADSPVPWSILLARDIWHKLKNSLLVQLGGMIAAITLLALAGMSVSWRVAETIQGNGEAINIAGSLRMQSWRMASFHQRLLQDDTRDYRETLQEAITRFEHDLVSEPILAIVPDDDDVPLRQVYQEVETRWLTRVKPALLPKPEAIGQLAVLDEIPVFVDRINDLVKQMEETVEAKILFLRIILATTIVGTLLVVMLSIYLLNNILFAPLKSLLGLTEHIRQGDLTARTHLTGEDEIGQLGQAFNRMAEDLAKLYQNLETRVEQKTAELTRSNRSLDLLYRSITRLHGISPDREVFQNVLRDAETVLGLGHGTICLKGDTENLGQVVATTVEGGVSPLCQHAANCVECHDVHAVRMNTLPDGRHVLRMPLTDTDKRFGILAVDVPAGSSAERWQIQLLEALSRHIGITIASEQRIEQHRRVSLLEERAVIARELHDSLAQSLAYMKIQVSRLRTALKSPEEGEEIAEALEDLREGLNSSYQQLRELLSTFRLRMEDADLGMALAQTTTEFAERGNLPITLDANLDSISLTPNEEIHVLQIVREALSNVLKHAKASHAWVTVHGQPDHRLRLQITDDGIGIQKTASIHHYGVAIMNERARALKGTLQFFPRIGGGTCVQLDFTPANTHHFAPDPRIAHAA